MNETTEQHLTRQELLSILNSQDPSNEIASQSDHLDRCHDCQTQLQAAAAEAWWWEDGIAVMKSTHDQVLNETNDSQNQPTSPNEHDLVGGLEGIEKILSEPRHPEMLGRLDEYEIERLIGVGGMGVVFKGFDGELNRPIAIKALLPRLASNGSARKRFAREARAAAAICHENVVPIHRIQSSGAIPYLVMPFVAGESLQSFVDTKNGPLDVLDIVQIGIQVASGLEAAHKQGLVHRDIKPANILLENGCNRIQITDFGLARAADDASLTRTGLIAGTPYYMSPEQASGTPVDVRSDLFSLGCVLYFLAAGRPPFRADGAMAVLNKICQAPATDIREHNPNVPKPLAFGIHRLLEKEPDDRFQTAKEVKEFLESLVAHLQRPTQHKSPAIKTPKSLRNRKGWLQTIGVLSVLAVAVAGIVLALRWSPPAKTIPSQNLSTTVSTTAQWDTKLDTWIATTSTELQEFENDFYEVHQSPPVTTWDDEVQSIHRRLDQLFAEER